MLTNQQSSVNARSITAAEPRKQVQSATDSANWQQFGWLQTLAMHLLPAAIVFAVALALAPLMMALHLPQPFGLTLAFAFVLIPVELGIVLCAAHKTTGKWSLRSIPAVLSYTQPIRKWWFLVPVLFIVAVVIAVLWSPLGSAIGGSMSGILPSWMLPSYDATVGFTRPVLVVTLLVTLLIDGIANPIVEELYFRGYLLRRLPVAGWRMVPLGAALFALQHYWQPYNWIFIFALELILITCVVRAKSIRFGIVMHVLANSFGVLLTLISVLTQ